MTGSDRGFGSCAFVLLAVVLAVGCSDRSDVKPDAKVATGKRDAAPASEKVRTVSVELLPVAERVLSKGADGELVWGALTDLEGVRVCLWKQRPMLGSFEDFVDVDGPCHSSGPDGKVPRFEGLPANSELVFRFTKDGFQPAASHFVTFEKDFVPPTIVAGARNAMLRAGTAEMWLEPPGEPEPHDGVAAVTASVQGINSEGTGLPGLGSPPYMGPAGSAAPTVAEGVEVTIVPAAAPAGATRTLTTLRSRPRWLALAEGEYRVSFTHPHAQCFWNGEWLPLPQSGYPTSETGVVRVPVFAGHSVLMQGDCLCDVTRVLGTPTDLASCSFADAGP